MFVECLEEKKWIVFEFFENIFLWSIIELLWFVIELTSFGWERNKLTDQSRLFNSEYKNVAWLAMKCLTPF